MHTDRIPDTPCICLRMRRATQRLKDFYDETVSPAGVSAAQYSLLVNISREEGCGTGELARIMKLEKSTLVRTLQPLLQAGYIEDRSPASSRKRRLFLTSEGGAVLEKAVPLWKKAQETVRGRLGENHKQFMEFLDVINGL